MKKNFVAVLLVLVAFVFLFSTRAWALDPRSGLMFEKAMKDHGFQFIGTEKQKGFDIRIYKKESGPRIACVVDAVLKDGCLVQVNVSANKKFPIGWTSQAVLLGFGLLTLSSESDIISNNKACYNAFMPLWDNIIRKWEQGGRHELLHSIGIKATTEVTPQAKGVILQLTSPFSLSQN